MSQDREPRAAEAVCEGQGGDGIDGGLNGGAIVGAGRLHGLLDGDGREHNAAPFVSGVRKVHDPVAERGGLVDEFAVGAGMNPVALALGRRRGGDDQYQQRRRMSTVLGTSRLARRGVSRPRRWSDRRSLLLAVARMPYGFRGMETYRSGRRRGRETRAECKRR